MEDYQPDEHLIELLLVRLERISVDSHLAHRASGIRGALIRKLEEIKAGKSVSPASLDPLIHSGFLIVELAASR